MQKECPESEKGDSDIDDEELTLPCPMSATTTSASCPASPPRPSSSAPSSPTDAEKAKATSLPPGNTTQDLVKLVERLLSSPPGLSPHPGFSSPPITRISSCDPPGADTSNQSPSEHTSQVVPQPMHTISPMSSSLPSAWSYFPSDPVLAASPANICPTLSDFVHLLPPPPLAELCVERNDKELSTFSSALTDLLLTSSASAPPSKGAAALTAAPAVIPPIHDGTRHNNTFAAVQSTMQSDGTECCSINTTSAPPPRLPSVDPITSNAALEAITSNACWRPSVHPITSNAALEATPKLPLSERPFSSLSWAACLGLELQQHLAALLQEQ
eukprot:GHVS01029124.1.p1 GENE.GHVS01029124.1~~GHVS01029124.1.p1  ORF type:complete len:329 (+),score=62.50 GHVS01029124.1:270-1256(+)